MSSLARLSAATLVALSPAIASAQSVEFASLRDGLELRAVDSLPANSTANEAGICGNQIDAPETEGGRAALAANWIVTQEITQNGLSFVSFVASTTPGTSGSCLMEGGNVGIFRGPDLLGLAYAAEGANRAPGILVPLEPTGIRIWDGDYGGMPLADLRVTENLVLARPIAERDLFCNGELSVPTLYGLPIHQARILLLAEGWEPQRAAEPSPSNYVQVMAEGLPELQDCSGTGFGYCGYSYNQEGGATLSVTTAGEGMEGSSPVVVGFGARCE